MRRSGIYMVLALCVLFLFQIVDLEAQRFPKPEFESGHFQPTLQEPGPRSLIWEYMDVFVLFACLLVATWLVLRKRSRKGVILLSVFSVFYFGFIRQGCVCSVGSIQNVALAIFNPSYAIPLSVILFFTLPLVFSLFFGRVFCSGVCPLGAIQDLVAIKPIELSPWLQKTLGILPFVYLALGVLYAATASDFVICRYDPFIGIFRLDGTFLMFVLGGLILITGVFIARPYCRFLCPYAVLLNWTSRFSKYHMRITPSHCIECHLCEHSCPFGAIEKPAPKNLQLDRRQLVKRYLSLVVIIPLLIVLGGWSGKMISDELAMVHPKVRLHTEIEKAALHPELPMTLNVESFLSGGNSKEQLQSEVVDILATFKSASWWLGAFLGLVIGFTLASLATFRYRTEYEPNRGNCLSCARCMDFCPVGTEKEIEFLNQDKSLQHG
jgi:NosR/NirI family nitrous oxide reductase transcriptional regulator